MKLTIVQERRTCGARWCLYSRRWGSTLRGRRNLLPTFWWWPTFGKSWTPTVSSKDDGCAALSQVNTQSGQINPRPNWMNRPGDAHSTANIDSDRGSWSNHRAQGDGGRHVSEGQAGSASAVVDHGQRASPWHGVGTTPVMANGTRPMIGTCMTSCPPSVLPTFGVGAGAWAPTAIAVAVPNARSRASLTYFDAWPPARLRPTRWASTRRLGVDDGEPAAMAMTARGYHGRCEEVAILA